MIRVKRGTFDSRLRSFGHVLRSQQIRRQRMCHKYDTRNTILSLTFKNIMSDVVEGLSLVVVIVKYV